jgi:hypothetical protein
MARQARRAKRPGRDCHASDPSAGSRPRTPARPPVTVTQQYVISQRTETALVIGKRQLNWVIWRLEGCRHSNWGDLWLAGAGSGAALAAGALVTALTLPTSGKIDAVLWVLVGAGMVIVGLCLAGYLSQRRESGVEIGEIIEYLKLLPGADAPSDE